MLNLTHSPAKTLGFVRHMALEKPLPTPLTGCLLSALPRNLPTQSSWST